MKNRYRRSSVLEGNWFLWSTRCITGDEIDLRHFWVNLCEFVSQCAGMDFFLAHSWHIELCEFELPEHYNLVVASLWFVYILIIFSFWRRSRLSAGRRALESACLYFPLFICDWSRTEYTMSCSGVILMRCFIVLMCVVLICALVDFFLLLLAGLVGIGSPVVSSSSHSSCGVIVLRSRIEWGSSFWGQQSLRAPLCLWASRCWTVALESRAALSRVLLRLVDRSLRLMHTSHIL